MKLIVILLSFFLSGVGSFASPTKKMVQYLSGTDNTHTKTWDFFCTAGRNSGKWSKIEVPSHWEQQGFGEYDYGRDYRTYGKKFKFSDEKGMYKHSFSVPTDWKGREVYIVFEGSMTDTEVKINGIIAGAVHQGAFYRFRYPVSGLLKFGQTNLLEVTVSKMAAEPTVNRAERFADYWIFGGIFRPVYLESYPAENIERVAIDARADGSFNMDVFTRNLKGSRIISADLVDKNNRVIGSCSAPAVPNDSVIKLYTKVDNPRLWTAELKLNLKSCNLLIYLKGK